MKSPSLGVFAAIAMLAFTGAHAAPQTDAEKIAAMEQKAKATIIPKLEFREQSAAEALAILAKMSDLKISYLPKADDTARITVSLSNIPAAEAQKYVTSLANLKFAYEADGVHVVPLDAGAK